MLTPFHFQAEPYLYLMRRQAGGTARTWLAQVQTRTSVCLRFVVMRPEMMTIWMSQDEARDLAFCMAPPIGCRAF